MIDIPYQEARRDKIHEAVKKMYELCKFDESKHVYTRVSDGKFLAGVSSITDITPKPYLMPWAAKEAVKFLGYEGEFQEMHAQICAMEPKKYHDLLHEAKGAYGRKSKEAMESGTEGHEWLERYVKAKIKGETPPPLEGFGPETTRGINQFLEWEKEHIAAWILSEARVADEVEMFAGTLDGMAELKDGRLAVIDFKFANNISSSYFLQTVGYAIPFERYDIQVEARIILRFPKTAELEKWDEKTHKKYKVSNDFEAVVVPNSYEFDREAFLAARTVYRWINSQ
jgi:hypothetical protein